MFGQLEAAADALHHLLHLISSGEAAVATATATTPAGEPANHSLQPHGPAPMNPQGQSFQSLPTVQQSGGWSGSSETAGASVPAAQTQPGIEAEFNQPQTLGESTVLVNSPNAASQPASQQDMQAKPLPQHPLQHQLPTQGRLPSDTSTQHQQVTHQPTHSQQLFSQQARSRPPRQDSSQQQEGKSPAQSEHAAASQGSLLEQPQHRRETSRQAGLPYFQLKLIREACHTVMTLAEKRGQPPLMLPLLQRMQQVCNRSPTKCNFCQE